MSTPYGSTGTTEQARKAALTRKDKPPLVSEWIESSGPSGGTIIIAILGIAIMVIGFVMLMGNV